jgi:hypothetical protein
MLLAVVASSALIAIAPASALAHGKHHKRHHHRSHHAKVHHRSFGGDQGGVSSQDQNAGTVQSFSNGVLTILLNNGQTVSGQVTGDTEIKCETAEDMSGSLRTNDRRGDNGGDNGDQGDDQGQGDDDNNEAMCDSSDLTPGTVVHEAELGVSSAGAVWDKVELVTASANNNNNNDDNDNDDD